MSAYWIAHVTITDPEAYKGYMGLAPAAFAKYGATFLARGGESETFEGESYHRQVVIRFPDMETARACYHSPEYAAARAEREGACRAHVAIVEGIEPV